MSTDKFLEQVIAEKTDAEKTWHKGSEKIVQQYEVEAAEEKASGSKDPYYNILFPNTEILLSSCFSQNPVPVVKPRRKTQDPIASAVSQLCEAVLVYQIDPNNADKPSFFDSLESCTLDALLPGIGNVQVRYDATFGEAQPVVNPETGMPVMDENGKEIIGAPPLESECCYVKHIAWNRVWWSKARKWEDVTWVAYGYDLSYADVKRRYKNNRAALESLKTKMSREGTSDTSLESQVVMICQVWNKSDGTVGEFCDIDTATWLQKPEPVPYKITGFFPSPRPLQYVRKSNTLRPTPLYRYYEKQAEELDSITLRLRKVINAIKVRGVHSGLIPELSNLFSEGLENTFVKAENPQLMMENGSLDKHIWVWPLDKLIVVAQSLYAQREQCKQVIYEMIGLGDIMRNSSVASESATAQKLKDKWGGLRLKRFKSQVQTYIRDVLRIMLEISSQKFDDATLNEIVGAQLPPPVLEAFRNFDARKYGIDVETDSTVAVEDAQEKEDVSEFLMGMGQLVPMMQALGAAGPTGIEAGKQILLASIKKFKFGRQVESAIASIKYEPAPPPQEAPPAPTGPTPAELELERYKIDADNRTKIEAAKISAASAEKVALIQANSKVVVEKMKPPPAPPAARPLRPAPR